MNASGPRATDDINLDEFERRLRAAGAQQARAEDPLAELSRLVEFSHLGISNGGTSARPVAEPAAAHADSPASFENDALRPTIDEEVEELAPGASEADREARQDYEFDAHRSDGASAAEQAADGRPKRWKLTVSALALAGVAMIGAVFALRGGVPGLPKEPPFIAAAQGPTKVAPPSDETVTASNDGASLLADSAKPGSVKVVNSEEQPVDLSAQASPGNPPSVAANPPAAADQAKPPASALDATSLAATVNTPLVPPPAAPPPAMTSEFPTPKPVRTVSLRPDGTPIAAANLPDQAGSDAKSASAPAEAPGKPAEAPGKPAPKTASEATGVAQPSTPKLDLPTKLSPKSSARVVVGKTDTTAPEAAQTPSDPTQNGAPVKPEKAPKKPKAGQVAAETTGAIAPPPVDATAATTSGGWAVQLAAPKSEAEAKSELTRLTGKYSADLNGSPIGVHKAVVNGETIYRLRVVGLTKADAAALCARLKGGGGECFIAK
ncbi:MAG: SPOR domain-containing protein [Roseiarcus sp.]